MAEGIKGSYASNKHDGLYTEGNPRENLDVTPNPNKPRPVENGGFKAPEPGYPVQIN